MEKLKGALMAEGLKCGGTLSDRAARLYSIKGLAYADIPQKLKAGTKSVAGTVVSGGDAYNKELARLEYQIQTLCDGMSDVVTATRKHAEKAQIQTLEEKLAEIEEEEYGAVGLGDEDDEDGEGAMDDDDGPIYNPLNLPLGWDGKPIPYWLYKLHGLGVEYKCEICGNQSYWGRRAFDKHFQEFRHAHGMRCLGIPNTKHFHDITLIEDALTLYSKIKGSVNITVHTFFQSLSCSLPHACMLLCTPPPSPIFLPISLPPSRAHTHTRARTHM